MLEGKTEMKECIPQMERAPTVFIPVRALDWVEEW
jgi:hypothetical protein